MNSYFIENVNVECETFNNKKYESISEKEDVPYIECNANINETENQLSIMMINKHFTDKLKLNLEIKGFNPNKNGKFIELTSEGPFDYNTIENRNKITIKEKEINDVKPIMTLELPAHSISILALMK